MIRRVILLDVPLEDYALAARAATWLMGQFRQDGIVAYGEHSAPKEFYVKRNKASITVRPCGLYGNRIKEGSAA